MIFGKETIIGIIGLTVFFWFFGKGGANWLVSSVKRWKDVKTQIEAELKEPTPSEKKADKKQKDI